MSGPVIAPGVRRSRSAIDAEVQVALGSRRFRAAILDLSLSGLRAACTEPLDAEPGQPAVLRFPLDSDAPLELRASVVRSAAGEMAFHFHAAAGAQEDALRALIRRRGQLQDGGAE